MAKSSQASRIYVLAGVNGAGKSSVAGAMFRQEGAEYFNPDEAANSIESANPGISRPVANSLAWKEGKRLLERAIAEGLDFAFETTLGGRTMTALLERALSKGFEVRIWYVGLNSVELHIERVRSRVSRGGHEIPEDKIRQRYTVSRTNLIRLLPKLTELRLYDNSKDADLSQGQLPEPILIGHFMKGRLVENCVLARVPEWAKAIMAAGLKSLPPR